MNMYPYIVALLAAERRLAEYFIKIAEYYKTEPGIYYGCQEMASLSKSHEPELKRLLLKQKEEKHDSLISMIIDHDPGIDLSTDLRYVWLLTREVVLLNYLLLRASEGYDYELETLCDKFEYDTEKQAEWLSYRLTMEMKRAVANA